MTSRAAARLTVVALLVATCGAGCSDDDPTSAAPEASSAPTVDETSEPTTEPTETPTEEETAPVEPSGSADPGEPFDLCSVDVSEVESTMGWSLDGDPSPSFGDSCDFSFDAADINVLYFDPPSMETLRDQSANFDIEELDGVGDEAFAYTSPFKITPTNAGVGAAAGDVVLQLGAFSVDEIATEEDLVEGMAILARLCLEAQP